MPRILLRRRQLQVYRIFEKWHVQGQKCCTVPVLGSAVPVSKPHGFKREVDCLKDLGVFYNISYAGEYRRRSHDEILIPPKGVIQTTHSLFDFGAR